LLEILEKCSFFPNSDRFEFNNPWNARIFKLLWKEWARLLNELHIFKFDILKLYNFFKRPVCIFLKASVNYINNLGMHIFLTKYLHTRIHFIIANILHKLNHYCLKRDVIYEYVIYKMQKNNDFWSSGSNSSNHIRSYKISQ